MKILHIVDSYLPTMGGIEMHVSDLASRQLTAGHDVTVLTATRLPRGEVDRGPVRVHRVAWNPLLPGTAAFVRDFVGGNHVDVIHAHLSIASPLAWAALRGPMAVARIATMHSVLPQSPAFAQLARLAAGIGRRDVQLTAVSEIAAQPLRRSGRMSVTVLPNGIDPARWRTAPTVDADSTFRVISVGRFARRKRIRHLVAMLAEIRAGMPPGLQFRAGIVGSGPQFHAVERDLRRCGLDDCVELPGALNRTQIGTMLADSSVYLAPAKLESFGIAALEARCAGLPVIAMACSGVGEFIADGVEGFLVDADAGMVAATLRLARDRELLAAMSRHNASTEPPMSWHPILTLHEAIYAGAIAARTVGPTRSVAV